jgi:hypothetical protein
VLLPLVSDQLFGWSEGGVRAKVKNANGSVWELSVPTTYTCIAKNIHMDQQRSCNSKNHKSQPVVELEHDEAQKRMIRCAKQVAVFIHVIADRAIIIG